MILARGIDKASRLPCYTIGMTTEEIDEALGDDPAEIPIGDFVEQFDNIVFSIQEGDESDTYAEIDLLTQKGNVYAKIAREQFRITRDENKQMTVDAGTLVLVFIERETFDELAGFMQSGMTPFTKVHGEGAEWGKNN